MTLTNLSQVTTSGIATLTDINLNNLTGVAATFTGNVTIGGTLTYNDVTNIDSVGLVTARNGIEIISGDLTIPDSIVHYGDSDTKIRFPSPNVATVETAGAERVRITTGVIGIGTNDPISDYRVTIKSSTAPHSALRLDTSESNYNTNLYFAKQGTNKWIVGNKADADAFRIVAGSTEVVRINSVGDVGIGTNSPHSNAGINLHIHGDNASSELRLTNTTTGGGGNGGVLQQSGNTLYLTNTENGNIVLETNGSEKVRITSSGLVGIGDNNPNTRLTVKAGNGDQLRLDNAGERYTQISIRNNGAQNAALWLDETDDMFDLFAAANYGMRFLTGATERARIKSDGKVGIGTVNPSELLHLQSGWTKQILKSTNLNTASSLIFDTHNINTADFLLGQLVGKWNGNDVAYINFEAGSDTTNKDDGVITFLTSSASSTPVERMRITSAGNLGVGNNGSIGLYTSTNDRNLILGTGSGSSGIQVHSSTSGWGGLYFGDATSGTARYEGYIEYNHTNNYLRLASNQVERVRITNAGKVGINKTNPSSFLHVAGGGYQTLRLENSDNGADGPYIELFNNSDSPADDDYIGIISFKNNNSADEEITYAQIRSQSTDITDATEDGILTFHTRLNGTFGERARITSDGKFGINSTNPGGQLCVTDASTYTVNVGSNGNAGALISTLGGSASLALGTDSAERLRITSGGVVNIGGEYTQTAAKLYVQNGGECQLKISGNAAAGGTGALLVLKNRNSNNSTGSAIQGEDASGQTTSSIQFINHSDSSNEGSLKFFTRPGNGNLTEHMIIDSNGPAYFKNSTGSLYVSSTTGNDGGRIVFREINTEAWSIDSTRANAPLVIKDEYNNKERFRIDASGKISWNDSSSNLVTTDTMMLQSNNAASTKSMLAIRGGDSGYVHAALRLVATSSHNGGNSRGTGVFMHDEASNVEWFAGRPYSSSDYFTICRNTGVQDAHTGGVTAQHARALWYVDNTGATRQPKEQCIYRVEASSHKSSRVHTVQGKQGTFSTCTIDFNQASYGSTVYDIKISGYSSAGFHRVGGYYCNSGIYAAFVSINNNLSGNISHSQSYVSSQTVRQVFTFSNGFVHPVCEVTASTGGDAYFVEGSITITWS